MTLHTSIDGAVVEIEKLPVGIDGAVVELDSLYAVVDGAKVEIFSAGKKVHNPVKSVTVTGTYAKYASNYGAAVTEDGKVVIYTKFTYNTDYEDVYFVDNGMAGDLVYRSFYRNSSNLKGYYYFAVFENVTEDVNVTLNFSSRDSYCDYVLCEITSTIADSGRDYEIREVNFVAGGIASVYDIAYCEDGNFILLAKTTFVGSLLLTVSIDENITLIDNKGYDQTATVYSTYKSGLYSFIIADFVGDTITLEASYTSTHNVSLTAS